MPLRVTDDLAGWRDALTTPAPRALADERRIAKRTPEPHTAAPAARTNGPGRKLASISTGASRERMARASNRPSVLRFSCLAALPSRSRARSCSRRIPQMRIIGTWRAVWPRRTICHGRCAAKAVIPFAAEIACSTPVRRSSNGCRSDRCVVAVRSRLVKRSTRPVDIGGNRETRT